MSTEKSAIRNPQSEITPLALALSWCDEDRELLGQSLRPLSLGSRHLLRLIGSRMLETDPGYDDEEGEVRDLTLFAWMHSAPLAEVTEAMWSSAWRAVLASRPMDEATRAEILPEWRERRLRMAALCEAVEYRIAPRPRAAASDTSTAPTPPADLINPTRLAFRIWLLMRETKVDRLEALWHFPYWQAVQICHAAEWHDGKWPVPVREETAVEEFEQFEMGGEDQGPLEDGSRK